MHPFVYPSIQPLSHSTNTHFSSHLPLLLSFLLMLSIFKWPSLASYLSSSFCSIGGGRLLLSFAHHCLVFCRNEASSLVNFHPSGLPLMACLTMGHIFHSMIARWPPPPLHQGRLCVQLFRLRAAQEHPAEGHAQIGAASAQRKECFFI